MTIGLILFTLLSSTVLYLYLRKKTRINSKYLFIDNPIVAGVAAVIGLTAMHFITNSWDWLVFLVIPLLVLGLAFAFTMYRFWRTPKRKIIATDKQIVSPADGNVIYINRVEAGEVPISIKGHRFSTLDELTKTELLDKPCWLVGINMTPFDVHKNCAPINGDIILNQHYDGKFLSLKDPEALSENERNTYVIKNDTLQIGIVQIASRLVRRIDSYVQKGAAVAKGDWLGMIRFGSQVDVILPADCSIKVDLKQQLYAGTTILAELPN